ncbi:hypothetical protein ACOTHX_02595 [Achromobacter xylosoxidans]
MSSTSPSQNTHLVMQTTIEDSVRSTNLENHPIPHNSYTFESALERLHSIKTEFERRGWKIHPTSPMGRLIKANEIFIARLKKESRPPTSEEAINSGYAHRISLAIQTVLAMPEAENLLHRLHKKPFDLGSLHQSLGKDLFWELEFFHRLKEQNACPRLEEPDIRADFGFGDYSISCKKIYSHKNLNKVLSSAANQVKKSGLPGLVALNIDDATGSKYFPQSKSTSDLLLHCKNLARAFRDRHAELWSPYFKTNKFDMIIISITVAGPAKDSGYRHINCHWATLATASDLPIEAKYRAELVAKSFSSIASSQATT